MVPFLFGQIAHPVDERQGGGEVFELESPFDPRAVLQQLPLGCLRQQGFGFARSQRRDTAPAGRARLLGQAHRTPRSSGYAGNRARPV